jgi:NPCBM/NEW2 domain
VHHPAGAEQLPADPAKITVNPHERGMGRLSYGGWMVLLLFCHPAKLLGDGPIFVADELSGGKSRGTLTRFDSDGSIQLGGAKSAPVRELLSLRRESVPLPPRCSRPQALLANGDRLAGEVLEVKGERLRFRPAAAQQELTIPLSALAGLWWAAPEDTTDPARFLRSWCSERRRQDTVLLRNGDSLEGFLTALGDHEGRGKTLRVQVDKKTVEVDLGQVSALALAVSGNPKKPRTSRARVILADGSRLAPCGLSTDRGMLIAATLFGASLRLPLEEVVAIYPTHSGVTALADLEPSDYQYTPYFGEGTLLYRRNASAAGNDILLAASTYDTGLGMRSQSRLTYRLNGDYRWFRALVGMDDRTGREGTARISVLVDGKRADLGGDPELTAQNGPRSVRVDVRGARSLVLLVDYGRRGNVQGQVDWADAVLIK